MYISCQYTYTIYIYIIFIIIIYTCTRGLMNHESQLFFFAISAASGARNPRASKRLWTRNLGCVKTGQPTPNATPPEKPRVLSRPS